jgi:hypothetical protein
MFESHGSDAAVAAAAKRKRIETIPHPGRLYTTMPPTQLYNLRLS